MWSAEVNDSIGPDYIQDKLFHFLLFSIKILKIISKNPLKLQIKVSPPLIFFGEQSDTLLFEIGARGMARQLRAFAATRVVHGFNASTRRQRQVHPSEFKVSLVHRASSLAAKTTHSSRNSEK